jgi:hypothetical protein
VAGVKYNTRNIQLDYTECEEDFLPYYPVMTDARRVSDKAEPIICLPTNCFYASRRQVLRHHLDKAVTKMRRKFGKQVPAFPRTLEAYGGDWIQVDASLPKRLYEKGFVPYVKGKHTISDLAQLDYPLMVEMLDSIRKRARVSGLSHVPVVLENHTKDLRNFSDLERFLRGAAASEDIKFLTLSQLATELGRKFTIKSRRLLGKARTNNR